MRNETAICHILADLINADGVIHPKELAFLDDAMETYGLTPAERSEVLQGDRRDAYRVARGLSPVDKDKFKDAILSAILADDRIVKAECDRVRYLVSLLEL